MMSIFRSAAFCLAPTKIDFVTLPLIAYGAIRVRLMTANKGKPNGPRCLDTTRSVRPADRDWVAIPRAWYGKAIRLSAN
jgi:hypothetical protein